jgi:hypothetical protein
MKFPVVELHFPEGAAEIKKTNSKVTRTMETNNVTVEIIEPFVLT